MTGVCDSKLGIIPFDYRTKLKGVVPNGSINVGVDDSDLHPSVAMALQSATGPIMHQVSAQKMQMAIRSLVDRSRLGDQNATAILVKMTENAKAGVPRAMKCRQYAMKYATEKKPETLATSASAEGTGIFNVLRRTISRLTGNTPERYAAVASANIPSAGGTPTATANMATVFANGPKINGDILRHVASTMAGEEENCAFIFGLQNAAAPRKVYSIARTCSPDEKRALQIGYTLGVARRIQKVREPNTSIALISPMAAWELGE
jgi:hypothetical protein